jgi:hypothetical protein
MDQWNTITEKRQRVTEREIEKERGREREIPIQTPGIRVKSLSVEMYMCSNTALGRKRKK